MKTILVVDDRHINREVLAIILDEHGYRILEAENGLQAIELLRTTTVDLIITDILMPKMDGLGLVKALQNDPHLQRIPIIFYSATYKAMEAYKLANASNVKYVLTKPCHPQTILETIEDALKSTDVLIGVDSINVLDKKIDYSNNRRSISDEKKAKFENLNLRLTNLIELGLDMSSEHDIEKMMHIACKGGRQILDACYAGMVLHDLNNENQYSVFNMNKENQATLKAFERFPSTGILEDIFFSDKLICIHSPVIDLEKVGLDNITLPITSLLAIPLKTSRDYYGKMYFINKFSHKLFTPSNQRFMMTLADKFSVNYENLVLYQEIQQHSKKLEDEISQRKKTETFLQEVTERLHLTLEAAHVGTWSWSIVTGRLVWDKFAAVLFGISLDEFEGTHDAFLSFVFPQDKPRVEQELYQMSRGNSNQAIEFRVIWPDKSVHHLMLRGKVHYAPTGEPIRMFGVYWDITENIQAEEKINIYREQMTEVIRSSALGEMASSLAHEINQPLAAIAAYMRGCIKRVEQKPMLTPEIIEILNETSLQAERAGEVINRMKSFVRKGELFYEETDVNALIKETFHLMKQEIQRYSVKINYSLSESLPTALVDKVQLQQVILNLLRNAMEAMHEGNTPNPEIIIESCVKSHNRITVRISDNGPGFSDRAAEHIFDLYFTTKAHGMGLGLAICRSIIEAHAGQISASVLPNGGSCFTFDFPVALAEEYSAPKMQMSL